MSHTTIYLDESGCLGFSRTGSSKYFIITILKIEDLETRKIIFQAVRRTIKNKVSKKRGISFELKGSNTSLSTKEYFHKHMPKTGWDISSIILKKEHIYAPPKTNQSKKKLYNDIANYVLVNVDLSKDLTRMDLYIDRSKNTKEVKDFNDHIKTELKLSSQIIFNINHVTSHENLGIQAVDLFCWGIARKYSLNDTTWYDCFKENVRFEEIYPLN